MNLNQVPVFSRDVEGSIEFYKRLGLRLIVKSLPNYARFECPDGAATFSVHLTLDEVCGNGTIVYFECENLDETVAALKAKNIESDQLVKRLRQRRLRNA